MPPLREHNQKVRQSNNLTRSLDGEYSNMEVEDLMMAKDAKFGLTTIVNPCGSSPSAGNVEGTPANGVSTTIRQPQDYAYHAIL